MNKSGSFWKTSKFWALFGFLVLLITLPILLVFLQQRQIVNPHAQTPNTRYYCAWGDQGQLYIEVSFSESPLCPDNSPNTNIKNYSSTIRIRNLGPSTLSLTGNAYTYICTHDKSNTTDWPPDKSGCYGAEKDFAIPAQTLGPWTVSSPNGSNVYSYISPSRSASDVPGGADFCGYYQNDFDLKIKELNGQGRTCDISPADLRGIWTWCSTSNPYCSGIPTPTNTPSPTPTTVISSPTPTPTPPSCPKPSPVTNIQITCPNCPKP